uniref:Uncharacterized protein n=1 Tax=Macaca nemestrina TaxID=9545 RepID=A0A2K6AVV9_MACNE
MPTIILILLIPGITTKMYTHYLDFQEVKCLVTIMMEAGTRWLLLNVTITSREWDKGQLRVDRERRNGRVWSMGHYDGQTPPGRARFACVVGLLGSDLVLLAESLAVSPLPVVQAEESDFPWFCLFLQATLPDD